jgi:hypothetical protein
MSLRRSSRIYDRDERKYIDTKKQMIIMTNKHYPNISDKADNIKKIYKLIYETKELFHAYATEEYKVSFMRAYITAGNKILKEPNIPKTIIRNIKPTVMKSVKYAEKYLKERGLLVRRALHKCEKNTCYNITCIIYSYI